CTVVTCYSPSPTTVLALSPSVNAAIPTYYSSVPSTGCINHGLKV
ncbi:hypothetical protein A2U01_0087877, partial [Trifolium medium]|nr:hypothetical protein [Trifolium medium]